MATGGLAPLRTAGDAGGGASAVSGLRSGAFGSSDVTSTRSGRPLSLRATKRKRRPGRSWVHVAVPRACNSRHSSGPPASLRSIDRCSVARAWRETGWSEFGKRRTGGAPLVRTRPWAPRSHIASRKGSTQSCMGQFTQRVAAARIAARGCLQRPWIPSRIARAAPPAGRRTLSRPAPCYLRNCQPTVNLRSGPSMIPSRISVKK